MEDEGHELQMICRFKKIKQLINVGCDFHLRTKITKCFTDPWESLEPILKMYTSHFMPRIGVLDGKLCVESRSASSHTSLTVFLLLMCGVVGSPTWVWGCHGKHVFLEVLPLLSPPLRLPLPPWRWSCALWHTVGHFLHLEASQQHVWS